MLPRHITITRRTASVACTYTSTQPKQGASGQRPIPQERRAEHEQLKQKLAVSEGCDERVSSERCGIQRRRRGPGPRVVDQAHERRTRVKAAACLPPCTSTTAPTHRPESGAESSNNKAGKEGEEDGRGETDADRSWRRVARPVPLQGAPHDTRPGTPMATCACAVHVPPRRDRVYYWYGTGPGQAPQHIRAPPVVVAVGRP